MKLLEHLQEPGRTVCLDNWFTSLSLALALRNEGMHLVGTIRQPKPYLPTKKWINDLKLPMNECVPIYHHDHKVNVIYKRVKPTKHVAIMTTIHNKFTDVEDSKTEAHMFYNASKGGVDAFDMMCAASNTSRKTRRWPLCIFFGLLNICMNNAYIVFASRATNRGQDRFDFTQAMAYNLARPWALRRYRERGHNLSNDIRHRLKETFDVDADEAAPIPAQAPPAQVHGPAVEAPEAIPEDAPIHEAAPIPAQAPPAEVHGPAVEAPVAPLPARRFSVRRQRCRFCPITSTWSGKGQCNSEQCGYKNICNNHSIILCQDCWRRQ